RARSAPHSPARSHPPGRSPSVHTGRLQQTARLEEIVEPGWPGGDRIMIVVPDAKAVAGVGVNMEFRCPSCAFDRQVKLRKPLRDVRPVLLTANQECRRSFLRYGHTFGNRGVDQRLKGGA